MSTNRLHQVTLCALADLRVLAEELQLLVLHGSEIPTRSLPTSSRPLLGFEGLECKEPPSILLVDLERSEETRLDRPLAELGFRVFRTSEVNAALSVLRDQASVLLAVVRMDLQKPDPSLLIGMFQQIRPGLWIGMLADQHSRTLAAQGYCAGAADLLPLSAAPGETAQRLARSIPWALRLRDSARSRPERIRKHDPWSLARRAVRTLKRPGMAALLLLGAALGVLFAEVLTAWQQYQDGYEARLERLLRSVESIAGGISPQTREFDRWYRLQELTRDREFRKASLSLQREQLEEERLRDLTGPPRPAP